MGKPSCLSVIGWAEVSLSQIPGRALPLAWFLAYAWAPLFKEFNSVWVTAWREEPWR